MRSETRDQGPERGRRTWFAPLLVLAALAPALLALTFPLAAREQPQACTQCLVTVDFAQPRRVAGSMIGFLRGMDESTPDARWIEPLHPAFWRGDFAVTPYERAVSFGARYEAVLSDAWSWGQLGPPYDHLAAWYALVRRIALAAQGKPVIWDIWNEPDTRWFWDGTEAQFEQTFATAEAAVRSVVGTGAVFVGPSLAWFDWPWMQKLLDYCASQGCRMDYLSWHETYAVQTLAANLRLAREKLLADPRLSSSRPRGILIDEYLGGGDRLDPGKLVGYLDALERGGAAGAVLSCWREPTGESNCPQDTLDGLLDPATGQPRGTWWTARAYADGVASQVQTYTSDPALAAIAASGGPETVDAQVLLGYFDPGTSEAPTTTITVSLHHLHALPFLRNASTVRISVERLLPGAPPSTPQPMGASRTVTISNGTANVTLPGVALQDAVVLHLATAS
jgi:xylan 1,4-beta-xylosidase